MTSETIEMTEVLAIVDGLSSPTNEEFMQALRGYSDTGVSLAATKLASEGGAGTLPTPQTETVTTDPDTFMAPDTVFDLDGPAIVLVKHTITAFDPDGETPGLGATDILVYPVPNAPTLSTDGVTYGPQGTALGTYVDGDQFTVGDSDGDAMFVPRFIKIEGAQIAFGTFSIYNGANNPTASVRIDVYAQRFF